LVKTQISSANKMLEGSASMARKLWRIEEEILEELQEAQE
jgi:hypothetical protein